MPRRSHDKSRVDEMQGSHITGTEHRSPNAQRPTPWQTSPTATSRTPTSRCISMNPYISISTLTSHHPQTRALRAYACLSHAAAAATFIPVQREQDIGNTAQDLPILNHIWSISSGVTGMAAGKVRTGRLRRLGRSWDFYNVYYIISTDPTTSPNQALLRLGRIPMIHGEFLVVRRSPSGHRLMDMRDVDTIKAISLIRRCATVRTTLPPIQSLTSLFHIQGLPCNQRKCRSVSKRTRYTVSSRWTSRDGGLAAG